MAIAYTAIATTTVGAGGTSTITFSNISQAYMDLLLLVSARGSRNANVDFVQLTINQTNTNVSMLNMAQSGGTTLVGSSTSSMYGPTNANGSEANAFGSMAFYISRYTNTNYNKNINYEAVMANRTAAAADFQMYFGNVLWSNTAAITRLDLTMLSGYGPNFLQNSSATLYGISNTV